MVDKLTDWYTKIDKKYDQKITNDKNFNNHLIPPCSMVSVIGPTGSGKTSFLVEFLSRKPDSFYEIIIFNPVNTDEPLYTYLEDKIKGIQLINDVEDLPTLDDYKDCDKSQEKLIVFDDICNLPKKELKEIQKFYCSARKFGFTCINLSQNYTDIPTQIRRNTQIFVIFRLNDLNTINHILKTSNTSEVSGNAVKQMYHHATKTPKNFLKIDLVNRQHPFTHNFKNILKSS